MDSGRFEGWRSDQIKLEATASTSGHSKPEGCKEMAAPVPKKGDSVRCVECWEEPASGPVGSVCLSGPSIHGCVDRAARGRAGHKPCGGGGALARVDALLLLLEVDAY